jgi:hypothetical protein
MALSDMLFGLFGQQDPRQRLAAALAGPQPQPAPAPAIQPGAPQTAGAQAAPSPVTDDGTGAPAAAAPVPPAQPANPTTAAIQQNTAPQQTQPMAYQTPPDLAKLYMDLADRQQKTEMFNRGVANLAAGFAAPGDRASMVSSMSGASGPSAGDQIQTILKIQEAQRQQQQFAQFQTDLPNLAKQLNVPIEQLRLPGVAEALSQQQAAQNTPLSKAQLETAVAGATTASNKVAAQKWALDNADKIADENDMTADEVKREALAGTLDTTIAANAKQTNEITNYKYYADEEKKAGRTPLPFAQYQLQGGAGTKLFGNPVEVAATDAQGQPVIDPATGKPKTKWVQLSDKPGVAPQEIAGATGPVVTAGERAQATAAGTVAGKTQATATADLPGVVAEMQRERDNLAAIRSSGDLGKVINPAFGSMVQGLPTVVKGGYDMLTGSNVQGTQSRIDQAINSKMSQAIQQNKTGIRLTQGEVQGLTNGISRLGQQNVNVDDYKSALDDADQGYLNVIGKYYLQSGLPREQIPSEYRNAYDHMKSLESGGAAPEAAAAPKELTYNPRTRKFE